MSHAIAIALLTLAMFELADRRLLVANRGLAEALPARGRSTIVATVAMATIAAPANREGGCTPAAHDLAHHVCVRHASTIAFRVRSATVQDELLRAVSVAIDHVGANIDESSKDRVVVGPDLVGDAGSEVIAARVEHDQIADMASRVLHVVL